jgi:hypothetical protein
VHVTQDVDFRSTEACVRHPCHIRRAQTFESACETDLTSATRLPTRLQNSTGCEGDAPRATEHARHAGDPLISHPLQPLGKKFVPKTARRRLNSKGTS